MARDTKSTGVMNSKPNEGKQSDDADAFDRTVRLNKWISECGVTSRRHADLLIQEGAVIVNGKKVYELGTRVNPETDRITVNGKPIHAPTERVYVLFNKPRHVMTTMSDPEGRPTIADFFKRAPVRVFPVGRLDWDSEGMILLTNDGEFAQKVNHPKNEILKTYLAKVSGQPSEQQLEKLKLGVSILGGRVAARHIERIRAKSEKNDWIKIMIAEGKNRQIHKMFEKIGFDVIKLKRIAIGQLKMPGALKKGEFVFLTPQGLERIFEPFSVKKKVVGERQRSVKKDARDLASRSAAGSSSGSARTGGAGSRRSGPPRRAASGSGRPGASTPSRDGRNSRSPGRTTRPTSR
jgi:23S rRNA pseudouridine2605 synthase